MPFNPLSISSSPNMGSINMSKLLRTMKFRTNNVRKFIFHRDAMFERDVGTMKDANGDGSGRSDALAGPPVSFGYETSDNTTRVAAADRAYHVRVDEINVMGLDGLIIPKTAQSSSLSRLGNMYSGSCDIYLPTVTQILSQTADGYMSTDPTFGGSEFGYIIENGFNQAAGHSYFDRFESRDELIDIERIVHSISDKLENTSGDLTQNLPSGTYTSGMTRLQFSMKMAEDSTGQEDLKYVQISGRGKDLEAVSLKWTFSGQGVSVPSSDTLGASRNEKITIDLPLIHSNGDNIKTGDTYTFQTRGGAIIATAAVVSGNYNTNNEFDLNKMIGDSNFDNAYEITTVTFNLGGGTVEKYDIFDWIFYESSNWVVDGITEYRDEYLKLSCNKLRGSSPSRRRAHG